MTIHKLCPDIIDLQARVRKIEEGNTIRDKEIRDFIEFIGGIKMLLALSIGGGALSIISIIASIATIFSK